jgi:hypothetical protein
MCWQDLVNGVETILGSFRPYLPSSSATTSATTSSEASPSPTSNSDATKALLQQVSHSTAHQTLPPVLFTSGADTSPSICPFCPPVRLLCAQSQGKCVELEGRIKVLEAQLHMSEERRVEETAALKDTLHTLSHAVGKAVRTYIHIIYIYIYIYIYICIYIYYHT